MSRSEYKILMRIPHGLPADEVSAGHRVAHKFAAEFPGREAGEVVVYARSDYGAAVVVHWTPGGAISIRYNIKVDLWGER